MAKNPEHFEKIGNQKIWDKWKNSRKMEKNGKSPGKLKKSETEKS